MSMGNGIRTRTHCHVSELVCVRIEFRKLLSIHDASRIVQAHNGNSHTLHKHSGKDENVDPKKCWTDQFISIFVKIYMQFSMCNIYIRWFPSSSYVTVAYSAIHIAIIAQNIFAAMNFSQLTHLAAVFVSLFFFAGLMAFGRPFIIFHLSHSASPAVPIYRAISLPQQEDKNWFHLWAITRGLKSFETLCFMNSTKSFFWHWMLWNEYILKFIFSRNLA